LALAEDGGTNLSLNQSFTVSRALEFLFGHVLPAAVGEEEPGSEFSPRRRSIEETLAACGPARVVEQFAAHSATGTACAARASTMEGLSYEKSRAKLVRVVSRGR